MDKKSFSLICAIVTSILWGSAFVAQDMGMDFIGPNTFNVGRFLIGFLTLIPFFLIFEFKNINFKQLDKKKIAHFLFFIVLHLFRAAGNGDRSLMVYLDGSIKQLSPNFGC